MNENVIVVIFSRNRAMQADLCLNTLYKSVQDDLPKISMLYKVDRQHEKSYDILAREHPYVDMVEEKDFKQDLLNLVKDKRFVLFVTDDTIFVQSFNLAILTTLLGFMQSSVGISLRLGNNTHFCYPLNSEQRVPNNWTLNNGYRFYQWEHADKDFGYALEVSSSIYRVEDIFPILEHTEYKNPNDLEAQMHINSAIYARMLPFMIYHYNSLGFANPINRVQNVALANKYGGNLEYTSDYLLTKYMKGDRIDYNKYFEFVPTGCHQEVELFFGENTNV